MPSSDTRVVWSADTALAFLRAGGQFSMAEWDRMSPATRDLMATAGDFLRRESALMIAHALRGPIAAAEIAAPIDGGAAFEQALVDEVVRQAVGAQP